MADDDVPPKNEETKMSGLTAQTPPANTNKPDPKDTELESEEETPATSRFMQSPQDKIKRALGIKTLDPHLEEMLKDAKTRETENGKGVMIGLRDGTAIEVGKTGAGGYIGIPDQEHKVSQQSAAVMISLAKASGWDKINVNGSRQERELLWLEAQRQGLAVDNFTPKPDSAIAKQWEEEKLHGKKVSPAGQDNPNPKVEENRNPKTDDDPNVKTIELLNAKITGTQDVDVRLGLANIVGKFSRGEIHADQNAFAALSEALSDKHSPKQGFNLVADTLNKVDPSLKIARFEDGAPSGTVPSQQATRKATQTRAPS